jgi:hypothetical protein
MFPSPCGEKVENYDEELEEAPNAQAEAFEVSVPLRGKGRKLRLDTLWIYSPAYWSFRPLAGKR